MAKIPLFVKGTNGKSCEGCTKCCEGYLVADIAGELIGHGKACTHCVTGSGCDIYPDRPKEPCRAFQCFWRASEIMPMEFKPSEAGIIVVNQVTDDGIEYLALVEAGNKVPAEVLSWYVSWAVAQQLNVEWQVGEMTYALGQPEFHEALARRAENIRKLEQAK
jgi:hypothetical protein